jgi:hypothetical protein
MIAWAVSPLIVMVVLVILAFRMEGNQTLGAKQALYLGAFVCLMISIYNGYQWNAMKLAPAEIEAYVPLYPDSQLKSRVPIEETRMVRSWFSGSEVEDSIRGQWIFETSDSTNDVGKFYAKWSRSSPIRVGVDQMMGYSEVIVDAPNYSFTVLANNHWGATRITYTLMAPLN